MLTTRTAKVRKPTDVQRQSRVNVSNVQRCSCVLGTSAKGSDATNAATSITGPVIVLGRLCVREQGYHSDSSSSVD